MAGDALGNTIPLSETTKFIVDNRGKTVPTVEKGIALIATNCVTNDHLYPLYESLRFISQETYQTWFRAHPKPGDILLTLKGSQNGATCLVPDPVDFCIAQDMVAIRANEEVVDPLFLFAALRSPGVQTQIKNLDVSGVIPHFKKTDFDKLHLPYPDRATQGKIGRTYFELSAKIDVNRRMSETLEAMARALFKSWFVEFEPINPKGGRNGRGEELLTLSRDTINPSAFPDESFEHYSIPAFDEGREPKTEMGGEIKSNKFLVAQNAVLLSKLNPRFPRVWLPSASDTCRPICSTEFLVAIPREGISREYLYGLFTSSDFSEVFASLVTGTSGSHQRVKPDYLLAMEVVIPPREAIRRYTEFAKPLLERIALNLKECRTLAALRDTLLPKLISGELRVKDAERFLKDTR